MAAGEHCGTLAHTFVLFVGPPRWVMTIHEIRSVGHVLIATLLVAATVIAATAGRFIDAAITGFLALLPICFLAILAIGRRRGIIDEH
jgi:cadmium resistance protein CadD (predicted permease)